MLQYGFLKINIQREGDTEEQEPVLMENDRTLVVREENTSIDFVQQLIHNHQQLIERLEQLEQLERMPNA